MRPALRASFTSSAKRAKKKRQRSKSGREYGGCSVWGGVLDPILSKYHWTLDYVLWEVSFVNVTMLQLDEFTVIDEEKDKNPKANSSKEGANSKSKRREGLSYGELINILMQSQ